MSDSEGESPSRTRKQSPSKQSPSKQSPSKQSPSKQSASQQSPSKQSASQQSASQQSASQQSRPSQGSGQAAGRSATASSGTGSGDRERTSDSTKDAKTLSPRQLAGGAARQLAELTGREPEGVTALQRTDEGWQIQLEVVEARRIPDSADMLALYDVDVDGSGELMGYRRVRRYARGHAGEG